jgi:hypothetical protein
MRAEELRLAGLSGRRSPSQQCIRASYLCRAFAPVAASAPSSSCSPRSCPTSPSGPTSSTVPTHRPQPDRTGPSGRREEGKGEGNVSERRVLVGSLRTDNRFRRSHGIAGFALLMNGEEDAGSGHQKHLGIQVTKLVDDHHFSGRFQCLGGLSATSSLQLPVGEHPSTRGRLS